MQMPRKTTCGMVWYTTTMFTMRTTYVLLLLAIALGEPERGAVAFQTTPRRVKTTPKIEPTCSSPQALETSEMNLFQPPEVLSSYRGAIISTAVLAGAMMPISAEAATTQTAGPIPSALMAYLHFIGILGVSAGLVSERFMIHRNMSLEEEEKLNNADGVYGLSALSLLISGYFRVTEYAKGWDFYKNEPIFWIKMASVAILGGLSFFPTIIFFTRDRSRKAGEPYVPMSDELVDRLTRVMNAEILALATIPLFASLMARGVLYIEGFPWAVGAFLYAVSLGGAGYKYGSEAFAMMEEEKKKAVFKD